MEDTSVSSPQDPQERFSTYGVAALNRLTELRSAKKASRDQQKAFISQHME